MEGVTYIAGDGLHITNIGKEHYEQYGQKYENKSQQRLQKIDKHINNIINNIQNYVESVLYLERDEKTGNSASLSVRVSGEKPLYIYFHTELNRKKLIEESVVQISIYPSITINGIPRLYEKEYYSKIKRLILDALQQLPASFYLSKLKSV